MIDKFCLKVGYSVVGAVIVVEGIEVIRWTKKKIGQRKELKKREA